MVDDKHRDGAALLLKLQPKFASDGLEQRNRTVWIGRGSRTGIARRCVSGAWRGRTVALHAIRGAEAQSQVVSSAEVRRIEHVAVDIAACHDAKLIGQNALAA